MGDNGGGAAMQLEFEKTRVNLWHVGAIAASIAVNAFALGGIYFTMVGNDQKNADDIKEVRALYQNEREARIERGKTTDANFKSVFDKMPQFDLINQQLLRVAEIQGAQAKALEETNKRIDRVVESQSNKLDTIIANVNSLTTEVRVVQSQLKQDRPQRTQLPIVNPELRMR